MRVRFADVGGIPTRYYEAGEQGPALMLVHGAGVSGDTWLRNLPVLGKEFRVVATDTLGHGFTGTGTYRSGPPHPYMVDHLIALADHLGWDRFAMCGSSFGAMLSILTHFKIPQRVEKLVLISSGSSTLSEEELGKSLGNAYKNGMSAMQNPTYENCKARMGRIFHDPSRVPEEVVMMQMTIYARPGAMEAYDARMKGMMDLPASRPYRVAERMGDIAAPTLLLWGLNDPRVIYERGVAAADAIPNSTFVGIDQCGHEPHMEHPNQFNDLVRRFMKGEAIQDGRKKK